MSDDILDSFTAVTRFDGDKDGFLIPDNESLRITTYTAEVWLKSESFHARQYRGILGKPGRDFNLWIHGQGFVHHRFTANGNGNFGTPNTPNGSLQWGKWHHIALTNDGTTARTYIDGELQAEVQLTNLLSHHTPFYVGIHTGGDRRYPHFEGDLADLRLFSVARSQDEIKASMNRRLTGKEDDLVLYWPLNDGTARDLSPNGNHGEPIGDPEVAFDKGLPIEAGDEVDTQCDVLALDGQRSRLAFGDALDVLDRELTIEVWACCETEPTATASLLYGCDARGESSLSVELPANGKLVWGCGANDELGQGLPAADYHNRWTHWAFVKNCDAGRMSIFRNGEKWDKGKDKNSRVVDRLTRFFVGANAQGERPWKGMLSELRVWDTERTGSQIRETMHLRLRGTEENLVRYWPMRREEDETIVQDETPFCSHGRLENATWKRARVPLLDVQEVHEHWALMIYVTPSAGQGIPGHATVTTKKGEETVVYGGDPLSVPGVMELIDRELERLDPVAGTRVSITVERTYAITTETRVLGRHRGDRFLLARGKWSERKVEQDVQVGGLASFLVWTRKTLNNEKIKPTKTILLILGDLLDVIDLGLDASLPPPKLSSALGTEPTSHPDGSTTTTTTRETKTTELKSDPTPDGRGVESLTDAESSPSAGEASTSTGVRPTTIIDGPTNIGLPRILGTESRARVFSRVRMLADALAAARQYLALPSQERVVDLLTTDDPMTSYFEVAFELRRDVDQILATQICPPRPLGPLSGIVNMLGSNMAPLAAYQGDLEKLVDDCRNALGSRDTPSERQEAFCQSVVDRGYTVTIFDAKDTVAVAEALDDFGNKATHAIAKATHAERRQILDALLDETSVLESSCDLHVLTKVVDAQPKKSRWTSSGGLDKAATRLQHVLESNNRLAGLHSHLYGRTIYLPADASTELHEEYKALELLRDDNERWYGWRRLLEALRQISIPPAAAGKQAKLAAIERMHRDAMILRPRESISRSAVALRLAARALPPKQWGVLLYLPGDGPKPVVTRTMARYEEVVELYRASTIKNLRVAMLADFPGVPAGDEPDPCDESKGGHRITFGGSDPILHTSLAESRRVLDSGNVELLSEFLEWGATQCPASRLALVVTGHAVAGDTHGPFTLCHDASTGNNLTLSQFCGAVRKGLDDLGRDKLDILFLDIPHMLSLEAAHELRTIAHVLIGWTGPARKVDYGRLITALDEQLEPAAMMELYHRWTTEVEDEELFLRERKARWEAHVFAKIQREVFGQELQLWDLGGIELLSNRVDMLCRLLMSNLADSRVWHALLEALRHWEQESIVEHLDAIRKALRQYEYWLADFSASLAPSHGEANEWVSATRAAIAKLTQPITKWIPWIPKLMVGPNKRASQVLEAELPKFDELMRGLGIDRPAPFKDRMYDLETFLANLRRPLQEVVALSPDTPSRLRHILDSIDRVEELRGSRPLAIYCPLTPQGQNHEDYLTLEFHQQVHLYALLTIVRVLTTNTPHRLWGLIALSIDHARGTARRELIDRLTNDLATLPDQMSMARRTPQLQFASLAEPPSITLSIKPYYDPSHGDLREGHGPGHDDQRYRVHLTSTKVATLPQGERQVNPQSFQDTISSFEMLLQSGYENPAQWSYLRSLGENLGEDIVRELKDDLERLRENLVEESVDQNVHLSLRVPPSLMRYPWELMSDGYGMLSERFAVGRQVWTEEQHTRQPSWRGDGTLRVLIIGAPSPMPHISYPDLPGARAEAEAVADVFMDLAYELGPTVDFRRERDLLVDTVVTRGTMRRLLREHAYDIVHFAGHGKYDRHHPERSAWILSDGLLWAEELRNTLAWTESPPWLIYANACEAGQSHCDRSSPYAGDVYGLATACINQGVRNYIAPLWSIGDETAKLVAKTFYRKLILERHTLGSAMLQARRAAKEWSRDCARTDGSHDLSWAGVVVYGDPGSRWSDSLGGSRASQQAASSSQADVLPGTGLQGEYYSGNDLTGPSIIRVDPTVCFEWGGGRPPLEGISRGSFSVRWTGQIRAEHSETYKFTTTSDDGVRLWVNDRLLIDDWTTHRATDNSGEISLEAGQRVTIKLEFVNFGGFGLVKLYWSSPSTPKELVPIEVLYPPLG